MAWDYCCCAIPVLNVGAYFTLSEQFVLGILVGTLSFATPALVGAAVPFTFAKFILSAFGYVFAFLQIMGFLGIFKEKPALFRRYVTINWIVLYAGMSVALAFLGLSAGRHTAALDACKISFFSDDTATDDKADQICNIFTWVIVGVMGGLWLVLFIVQSYLILVLRNYGVTQRADHTKGYEW